MSTTRPSATTARSHTASAVPGPSRQAIRVMIVGLALSVVALAAPLVDRLTAGDLAAHLGDVYAGTGVAPPAVSTILAYLVGLEVLAALCWVSAIQAVRRGRRLALLLAATFLVLGAASAVVDLAVSEYGRPILPTWLGVLGLLPCLPGFVAVVLLARRSRSVPTTRVV